MKIAKSNGVRVTTENGKSIDGGSPPPAFPAHAARLESQLRYHKMI
jgi:hypothetical protein